MTAIDTVQVILDLHPEIAELTIFEPNYVPPAQVRVEEDSSTTQRVIESGLKLRRQSGLPFWDSVLVSCYGHGDEVAPILEQALFHNSPSKRKFAVSRGDWSGNILKVEMANVSSGNILVLSSRVRLTDDSYRHIPMVDFHCPPSENSDKLALKAAKLLYSSGGYILHSGWSYHFYGKSLLTESELPSFLARALLLSPITDRAWIAHQLIEGACGLRISAHPQVGNLPHLLAEFE